MNDGNEENTVAWWAFDVAAAATASTATASTATGSEGGGGGGSTEITMDVGDVVVTRSDAATLLAAA